MLFRCLRAFSITSSLSEHARNLAIIGRDLNSLEFYFLVGLFNLMFLFQELIHNFYSVLNHDSECSADPSSIVRSVFSGTPKNTSPYTRAASSSHEPHAPVSWSRTSSSLHWNPSSSSFTFVSIFVVLVFKT